MQTKIPKLLSLVIPVYKQEKTIIQDIRNAVNELERIHVPYEIIVVVDGFLDRSFEYAKTVRAKHLFVYGYADNKGKGYAVRYGIGKSKGDVIAFMDAGGDLKVDGLGLMLEHFRWYNADIVIGSKLHGASKVEYPWQRKVLSKGYQLLNCLLFGLRVRDTQVGMKFFRRKVLEDVLPRLVVKEFAFDIEILAVAHHLGYTRIYEAPVEIDFNGKSSITTKTFWRVIFKMLWDTLAVYYRLRILRYYDTTSRTKWKQQNEFS